jgi:hypothetical protein
MAEVERDGMGTRGRALLLVVGLAATFSIAPDSEPPTASHTVCVRLLELGATGTNGKSATAEEVADADAEEAFELDEAAEEVLLGPPGTRGTSSTDELGLGAGEAEDGLIATGSEKSGACGKGEILGLIRLALVS